MNEPHGDWLATFRVKHNLKNKDLASITGYSEHAIGSWMKAGGKSAREMPSTARRTLELWAENGVLKRLLSEAKEALLSAGIQKNLRRDIERMLA